jgi:hypothetical protein
MDGDGPEMSAEKERARYARVEKEPQSVRSEVFHGLYREKGGRRGIQRDS